VDRFLAGALEKLVKLLEVKNRGGILLLDEQALELYLAVRRGFAREPACVREVSSRGNVCTAKPRKRG